MLPAINNENALTQNIQEQAGNTMEPIKSCLMSAILNFPIWANRNHHLAVESWDMRTLEVHLDTFPKQHKGGWV